MELEIHWFLDDIIYEGDESTFRKIALYASICAILVLDLEAQLLGEANGADPQIFYPTEATPTNIQNFIREYRAAFDILIPFFENNTSGSSSPHNTPLGSDAES